MSRLFVTLGVVLGTASASLAVATPAHANAPIDSRPVAQISMTHPPGPLTVGTPLTLDATSSYDAEGDSLTYEWTVTSSEFTSHSTQASYEQRFDEPGAYHISLKVTDTSGGDGYAESDVFVTADDLALTDPAAASSQLPQPATITDDSEQVTVIDDPPSVYVTQTPSSPTVAPDTTVTFDGSGSRGTGELTYAWYLGGFDNVVGTHPILEYTFTRNTQVEQPIYIMLTVTDSSGQAMSWWTHITVVDPTPVAAVVGQSPSSASVRVGTKVSFDGSRSTGDGLRYAWRVRGEPGVVGTGSALNYTFKTAGSYGIELTVTDAAGHTAKKWTGLQVVAADPPTARFVRSPLSSTVPLNTKVNFDGSASTGDGLTYEWYVRGQTGVVSRAKVLNHTFTKAGSYGIELRVTDAAGRVAKQWTALTVADSNRPPIARFTQDPASSTVKAGTTVTFNGSASSDPDATSVEYRWYVRGEKGVVSTSAKMTHTFKKAGTYGVELKVVDPSGAVGKKWIAITVTG